MSQQSYWKGGGKDALLGKAVVSPTGHVVAKNYDPKAMHEGDLGLSVRIDRKFDEMTPEQRMAAAGVADELAALLRQGVGAETDLGFRPGMVVRATSDGDEVHGLIERITPFSVLLRVVSTLGALILKQLPLGVWALEERTGFTGVEGLLIRFCTEASDDEIDVENFDDSVMRHITSDEGIRRCFVEGGDANSGCAWVARHLPNEDLRAWVLLQKVWPAHDVLPTVERIDTIVSWIRTFDSADSVDPSAFLRLHELDAPEEVYLELIKTSKSIETMVRIASYSTADAVLEVIRRKSLQSRDWQNKKIYGGSLGENVTYAAFKILPREDALDLVRRLKLSLTEAIWQITGGGRCRGDRLNDNVLEEILDAVSLEDVLKRAEVEPDWQTEIPRVYRRKALEMGWKYLGSGKWERLPTSP